MLDFLYYYFNWFVEKNCNYINTLFTKTFHDVNENTSSDYFIFNKPSQVVLTLTPFALEKGYRTTDIEFIKDRWFRINHVYSLLQIYKNYIHTLDIVFYHYFTISCSYIVFYFFNFNISY